MRAFEVTAEYVQNYVQGGRILIKHQAVALRLADMATKIEAVRALLERAARAVDDNAPDAEVLCNMAKMFASEEIMKVAQHAVELHGGNGMMLDFGIEKVVARRRDLPAHGCDGRHLEDEDRQEHVPADRRANMPGRSERDPESGHRYFGSIMRKKSYLTSEPESDQHDHQADELRDARHHAEREIADQQREARHQRRKHRGASGAEQHHRAGEQIDRQHAGEDALHRACSRFSARPMRMMRSKPTNTPCSGANTKIESAPTTAMARMPDTRHCRSSMPKRRPEHAGGDEQQVAADAMPADGGERFGAEHQQAGDDGRRRR